jgi:histidine triad (HIT) family protein
MAPECIFCKIVQGQIPATKVLEDDHSIAFLDIGPLAKGHILLIPKAHAETMDDLSALQAGQMMANLPALVKAVQAATGCEGVNVLQNNGKVAHQEVMHVHVHVIPRTSGDSFRFNWPAMRDAYSGSEVQELAEKIKAGLGS